MMPEFENFNVNFDEMIRPSLEDPDSERVITHIGLHQYNGAFDASSRAGAREFPQIIASGKQFWQTEVSGSNGHIPPGNGMANALYWARMIHWDFTLTQVNAFLFWWLWTNNPSSFSGALIHVDDDVINAATRLYVMGQYSRFIRPGWNRIHSDTVPRTGVYSSAYRNPQTNEIAIVIINERLTAYNYTLEMEGAEFEQLEIYRTSENENLRHTGRQRVSGNTASVYLTPMSVTTFYGTVR
jgi:O-glycosyl hydrolase